MTYVTEQTGAELRAHMRRLQKMPGWHNPLDDRLFQEVLALDAEIEALRGAPSADVPAVAVQAEPEDFRYLQSKLKTIAMCVRDLQDEYATQAPAAPIEAVQDVSDTEIDAVTSRFHGDYEPEMRPTHRACARAILALRRPAHPVVAARYETPGYALAMRVMQSDRYPKLDGRERSECDAFIAEGQSAAPVRAVEQQPVAWAYQCGDTLHLMHHKLDHYFSMDDGETFVKGRPLVYLAAPKEEPAVLTQGKGAQA